MKSTLEVEHYLLTFPTHYLWPPSISVPSPFMPTSLPSAFLTSCSFSSFSPCCPHSLTSPDFTYSHRLHNFLSPTTIILLLSCSCSHFSAFHFNHTTTPLPHPSTPELSSLETSVHFSCHPWFTFVQHPDFFSTNFLHTVQNIPLPSYCYSTPLFLPAFSFSWSESLVPTFCCTEMHFDYQLH